MLEQIIGGYFRDSYGLEVEEEKVRAVGDELRRIGFQILGSDDEMFEMCQWSQKKVKLNHSSSEVPVLTKVFLLGYKYDHLETYQDNHFDNPDLGFLWPGWLGSAEYNLAKFLKESIVKANVLNKAKDHLINAGDNGDERPVNSSNIGRCLFKLGSYEEALDYFLESQKRGNQERRNFLYIGQCYFHLGVYEKGIVAYERVVEIWKEVPFNITYAFKVLNIFTASARLLSQNIKSIRDADTIVNRFNRLFDDFANYFNGNVDSQYRIKTKTPIISAIAVQN